MSRPTVADVDPEAVTAAVRGDPGGLRQVAAEAYPFVRRWVAASTADPADIDDATQDVMVLMLRRIGTFRQESRFTTWLYQITRNALFDRYRSRGRREKRTLTLDKAEALPTSDQDPLESVGRGRVLGHLEAAFRQLPKRQRQVFDLSDLQGFTSPEIAEMLDLAPSSIRVSLLKARRTLRRRVLEMDPDLAKEFGG